MSIDTDPRSVGEPFTDEEIARLKGAVDDPVASALAAVEDSLDSAAPQSPPRRSAFITVLRVGDVFVDYAYQRPLDDFRVQKMVDAYDASMVGVIEVSARPDDRYAVIDGQHRWAMLAEVLGRDGTLVANVHSGLTVEDEAGLFYEIDKSRRALTGWDRWYARRGSGDREVLAIEAVVESHHLKVSPTTKDGVVRATRAMEHITVMGGTTLLDSAISIVVSAWGRAADALDGDLLHGVALVLHHYDLDDEVDVDRLVAAMQDIAPRQVKARAVQLREAHKGVMPRLVAAVLMDRYNAAPGRKVDAFLIRLPQTAKTQPKRSGATRRDDAIRIWARRQGVLSENKHRLSQEIRDAYAGAHPEDEQASG